MPQAVQSKPHDAAIGSLTWRSLPMKKASDFQLAHDMTSRYTRHCPRDEVADPTAKEGSSAQAPPPTLKEPPRLVPRDYEVLDVLCSADVSGARMRVCWCCSPSHSCTHISRAERRSVMPVYGTWVCTWTWHC